MPAETTRILVVDDDPAGRYATSHILRSAGWEVIEAASGQEALEQVAGVDLVVLDVNLPDIDGFEVCRRIRAIESLARLPVIHLSATFVKDVDKIHGLDAGADGYLVHPAEPPVLIATVRAFLRARQAERDREQLLARERAARAEAEAANRIKDEFLATLSHELRTPLHAIIGWTRLLKLGALSPGEVQEGVNTIERNAQLQAQMIADLLDISRITSGKLRLDVQQIDAANIIEAALSSIQPAVNTKGIQIAKKIDPAGGLFMGDSARIQQVVWNLVNNAVKFTPRGGKVQLSLERDKTHVHISVEDTGKGIDSSLLPRVFERFYQGDASTTREFGGLGLGLAIAKQLVELHGGTISAQSAGRGKGTKFTVMLPVSMQERNPSNRDVTVAHWHQAPDGTSGEDVRLDGVRILVVDDDGDSREVLTRILQKCGADTRDANGVQQALAALPEFKPQVLISDVGMPGQDGFELIRRVRAQGCTVHDLPAIALTGFAAPDDRRRALLAGFQAHMAKPVDPRELTAAIAALVGTTGG